MDDDLHILGKVSATFERNHEYHKKSLHDVYCRASLDGEIKQKSVNIQVRCKSGQWSFSQKWPDGNFFSPDDTPWNYLHFGVSYTSVTSVVTSGKNYEGSNWTFKT